MRNRSLRWWPTRRSSVGAPAAGASKKPASGPNYAAFISYSHAVDGKLAPSLQGALHRFAKPWYRLRALRVFRDETSLAVTPELWPSIELALANSDSFVLLASPLSARSEWVGREVSWWLEHKPLSRFYIVLTDGELEWDAAAGDFDWPRTTALPSQLRGRFHNEPRYVDLRWARGEQHLSLADPRFRGCVADLAAPLHGRPKDEMVGEEVRQHRRTVRLVRTTIAVLTVLLLLAASGAVAAVRGQTEARNQRDLAEAKAREALSRQLAAQAVNNLSERPVVGLFQSLKAIITDDTVEARGSLLAALLHDPTLDAVLPVVTQEQDSLTSMALSPDGATLVVGTELGRVIFWDLRRRRPLGKPLREHRDSVEAMAFHPKRPIVASASRDGSVKLWDIKRQRLVMTLHPGGRDAESGFLGVAFSPNGRTLATSVYSSVFLWDLGDPKPVAAPLQNPVGELPTDSLAFSPDGQTLVAGAGGAEDEPGTLSFWELRRGAAVSAPIVKPTQSPVEEVAFPRGGKTLAAGMVDGTIGLWDVTRRRQLGGPPTSSRNRLFSVAFSPDGETVASGSADGAVVLWHPKDHGSPGIRLAGHTGQVLNLAFSRDGRTLASADSEGTVILRNLRRQQRIGTAVAGHTGAVESLAFSSDGDMLASGGADERVVLWDVPRRQASAPPLQGHGGTVRSLVFGRDRQTLVTASVPTYGDTISVLHWNLASRKPRGDPLTLMGFYASIQFSPDGQQLAWGGPADNDDRLVIKLWDAMDGRTVEFRPPNADDYDETHSLAFSPDGATLAAGSTNRTVTLWDVRQRRMSRPPLTGHNDFVSSLSFSPDGHTLAAGSRNKTIGIWDLGQPNPAMRRLLGNTGWAWSLAFSPNGEILASGHAEDGTVTLWDVRSALPIGPALSVGKRTNITSVAFSPDGRTLAVGTEIGTVMFWDLDVGSWQRQLCSIVEPLLRAGSAASLPAPEYDNVCHDPGALSRKRG